MAADPLARLRHHVSGAIERGEAEPIIEQPSFDARLAAEAPAMLALLRKTVALMNDPDADDYLDPARIEADISELLARIDGTED